MDVPSRVKKVSCGELSPTGKAPDGLVSVVLPPVPAVPVVLATVLPIDVNRTIDTSLFDDNDVMLPVVLAVVI